MEMNILYAIQNWHSPVLDSIMVTVFNTVIGEKGQFWIALGALLLLIPKTRKSGICVIVSYILAYVIGDGILKDFFARPRPCAVDETVELLIKRSTSYSCPSVHSMLAFASAMSIFLWHRKIGIPALVLAALVGFSRLYFFVHYPTDVLFGAVLGCGIACGIYPLCKSVFARKKGKKNECE